MLKINKLLNNLDVIIAVIMLIISLFMLIFFIKTGGIAGRVITMLFSLLLPPVIYLVLRNKKFQQCEYSYSKTNILFTNVIFLLLFIISIYLLYNNIYVRPLAYFIIISIMAIIVIFENHQTNSVAQEAMIILKIILIAVSLRFGILYEFPGLLGIDPPYHVHLVNTIAYSGFIPSSRGIYFDYPMSYILQIINELIIGFDYKNSLVAAIGIPMIISILFVYLLGRILFNKETGVIAALFISAYPFHLLYSYVLIPNGLAFVFYSIIIYLILCNKMSFKILTLILLFPLLLSHPLVPPILIFTIIAFSIGSQFYKIFGKKTIPTFSIKLIIIAIFTRWMYGLIGAPIFGNIIETVKYTLTTFEDPKIVTSPFVSVSNDLLNESLNTIGIALLTMLAMIGVLYIVKKEKNNHIMGFTTVGLSMFLLTTTSAMIGLSFLLPQRWLVFLGIFLAILAAFGLTEISSNKITKSAIVFILIFFMITNSFSNMDSPIYAKEETVRYAYTESEIHSVNTINRIYDGRIITDESFVGSFRSIPRDIEYINVPFEIPDSGIIIVRNYILNNPIYIPSIYASSVASLSDQDKITLNQIDFNNDKIYTNGQVNAYRLLT